MLDGTSKKRNAFYLEEMPCTQPAGCAPAPDSLSRFDPKRRKRLLRPLRKAQKQPPAAQADGCRPALLPFAFPRGVAHDTFAAPFSGFQTMRFFMKFRPHPALVALLGALRFNSFAGAQTTLPQTLSKPIAANATSLGDGLKPLGRIAADGAVALHFLIRGEGAHRAHVEIARNMDP